MDNEDRNYQGVTDNTANVNYDRTIGDIDTRDVEMAVPDVDDSESEWDVDDGKICFCLNRDALYDRGAHLIGRSVAMVCSIVVVVIVIVVVT